ncbi:hypothetical protein BKN49_06075 [Pseudomonas aeruginosa]|nr:hypothetical protein BKN49_06075 [Pseudomonas aeruginosa]
MPTQVCVYAKLPSTTQTPTLFVKPLLAGRTFSTSSYKCLHLQSPRKAMKMHHGTKLIHHQGANQLLE